MLPNYRLFLAAAAVLLTELPTLSARVIVTGVKVDPKTPSVPPRKSIVDLYSAGGPQW